MSLVPFDTLDEASDLVNATPYGLATGLFTNRLDVALKAARRLLVHIPMGFTEMLARNPELALAWRVCTRAIFTTYFARGYKAVDFMLDRTVRRGRYLLTRN